MARSKDRLKKKILELLSEDPIISIAVKKAGVGRATFYRWCQEDKEFAAEVEKATAMGDAKYNDITESKLMSCVRDGNMRAIMYRLDNCSRKYSKIKNPYDLKSIKLRPIPVIPAPEYDKEVDVIEIMGSIKGPYEKSTKKKSR